MHHGDGERRAKPPETTPYPETEFKVLSPLAQEFHQPDEANDNGVFVPLTEWAPVVTKAKKAAESLVNSLTSETQWARLIFEMAETHRQAGDWNEARIWYSGVQKLYPKTVFAQQAAERLERYRLLRVAAEAGEEQSEEPPIAGGVERLTVMPREVDPRDQVREGMSREEIERILPKQEVIDEYGPPSRHPGWSYFRYDHSKLSIIYYNNRAFNIKYLK